jgi:hypothetical protein
MTFYQQIGARCLDKFAIENIDSTKVNFDEIGSALAENVHWPFFFQAAMLQSMRNHAVKSDPMNLIAIDFFLYGLLVGSMMARAIMEEQQLNEMTEVER